MDDTSRTSGIRNETVVAWLAFFDSLGLDLHVRSRDGWEYHELTGLGDGTLTVRWRVADLLTSVDTLVNELSTASAIHRDGNGGLTVLVDAFHLPTLFVDAEGQPVRDTIRAYVLHPGGVLGTGPYRWVECPGCEGFAYRQHGWCGGCPADPPRGDEFVYRPYTPRLTYAYAAGAAVL